MRRKPHAHLALGLTLVAAVAVIAWQGRPPVPVGPRAPSFRVPPAQQSAARALVDSLFALFAAPIDTVALDSTRWLRLVLYPGAYMRPPRIEGNTCKVGPNAEPAMTRLAAAAYRLYSQQQPLQGVIIVLGHDSAVTGGWFHRTVCRSGGGRFFYRPGDLDTVSE